MISSTNNIPEGIDYAFIESIVGQDPKVIRKLILLVITKVPHEIERLREAIGKGDNETIVALSHNLKSNFKNLGAFELSAFMSKIEVLAKTEGQVSEIETNFRDFEERWNAIRPAIEEFVE